MHSSSPYHNVAGGATASSGITLASSPLNQQPPPLNPPPSTTLQYTQSYGSEMQGASSSFTPVASSTSAAAAYRAAYSGKIPAQVIITTSQSYHISSHLQIMTNKKASSTIERMPHITTTAVFMEYRVLSLGG